jgi:hypothetical protein
MNSPEQKKPHKPPTNAQQEFMKNILLPKKPLSEDESLMKEKTLEELTKNKEKNTLNIIHGKNIAEYKEYLQARCNKLCLFKTRPDIKPFYKGNRKVKAYIDKNCQDCIRTLREFNRALDTAIKKEVTGTDPSSPTANLNMIVILLKNGKAIFDALPLKFRKELEKFEPLDDGDIRANKYSLLNELEINVKSFIERNESTRRHANLLRRTRHGGRKTKRKKRRRKKKKRKRKTKRKKRYKN